MNIVPFQTVPGGPELLIVLFLLFIVMSFFFVLYRVVQGAIIYSNRE